MKTEAILDTYAYLFARKNFYRLNRFLFLLSLRGMGVLNYKSQAASGEAYFLEQQLGGSSKPVVFDVGANAGGYSSAVLATKPDAQLYAFEPHPETFQRLSENLKTRAAGLMNAACGKAAGEMVLYDYAGSGPSEHASLYAGVIEQLHGKQARAHTIQVLDLDTFADDHNIERIDLLKIDTEGHELEVLNGSRRLLADHRIAAIHFEFNEMNVVSRTFFRDFYSILSDYTLYRMVRDGLIPLPVYSPIVCEIFAFQNIVALPRSPRP